VPVPAAQYVWQPTSRWEMLLRDRAATPGGELDQRHYPLKDALDVVALSDAEGAVIERYSYSAFGMTTFMDAGFEEQGASAFGWEFLFHAEFRDADTGWYNYGYRYYSTQLGRWLARDPIGTKGGINIYALVGNDAVNEVDYLGLEEVVRNGYRMAVVRKPPPKKCCDKAGAKATNCFNISIWASEPSLNMAAGHAGFGLPGGPTYGLHRPGYKNDDEDMKGSPAPAKFECCCLTDEEMDKLRAKIKEVEDKIAKGDKTDLNGREYSLTSFAEPNPTCSGSAAGFASGMGCPNIPASAGAESSPADLLRVLQGNKFCKGL
jgi:RHS repeat-associated protein